MNVGNPTGGAVTVGLKRAVIVRSGVGKTIGVGEEIKGKLQARAVKIITPIIRYRTRGFLYMLASHLDWINLNTTIIGDPYSLSQTILLSIQEKTWKTISHGELTHRGEKLFQKPGPNPGLVAD